MTTSQTIAAALRIGQLTHEATDEAAVTAALEIVRDLVSGDAACLVSSNWDGNPHPVAAVDYPPAVTQCLTVDFAASRWQRMVLESPLPPSIASEADQSFARSWIYEDVLAPAGFRDGVTCALRQQGRYVGSLHVSSARGDHFSPEQRALLASFSTSLALMADVSHRVLTPHVLSVQTSACLVVNGEAVALPHRPIPSVMADREMRDLLAALHASGGSTSGLWPTSASTWYRIQVRSRLDSAREQVLVLTQDDLPSIPYRLTRRELDVLTRIVIGMSNEAIAHSLTLSERTVHSHVANILVKTGARSRTEVAALASRRGILRPTADLLRRDHMGVLQH